MTKQYFTAAIFLFLIIKNIGNDFYSFGSNFLGLKLGENRMHNQKKLLIQRITSCRTFSDPIDFYPKLTPLRNIILI